MTCIFRFSPPLFFIFVYMDSCSKTRPQIGGQAVIEGVMMRSPHAIATAVRIPDGRILIDRKDYTPVCRRHRFLDIPIIRGAITFFEMLIIGIKTLSYSADVQIQYAEQDEQSKADETPRKRIIDSILLAGSILLAIVLAMGLFFYLPLFFTQSLGISRNAIIFNIIAGVIRLSMLLCYIYLISLLKDVKRLFEYHGAEHMSVFAFEEGCELSMENVKSYGTHHPRCGTSYLFIVMMLAILFFSIVDSLFVLVFGHSQSVPERFATHFLFLPIVAGISYELLKLSDKMKKNRLINLLIVPGLWLQRITTSQPDESQLEVAIEALKSSLKKSEEDASDDN